METQGLSGICTSLGIIEEDKYGNVISFTKGEYCLDNLKDLLRFLRRDDPQTRCVFKQVCKWKITSKYLVPILRYCQKDRNLVLNTAKVLVFLTMPIDASSCDVIEQTEYLWTLKSAVTNEEVIAIFVSLLEGPLENLQEESLTEDDWKVIQLLMTLFRNLLAIQDVSTMKKSREPAFQLLSLRDKFLELLFKENVMDIILVITENIGGPHCYFRQDNLLLLEIFYRTVMGQDPKLIADAGFHEKEDTLASLDKLESIMKEEQEKRRLFMKQNINRHSNFGGTFARLSMNGAKTLCQGIPNTTSRNVLLRRHKAPKGVKKFVKEASAIPTTQGNLLRLVNDFLNQFLSGCYNVLMQSVRDDIEKEAQTIESSDVVVFFNLAQFVMSFQHHKTMLSQDILKEGSSVEKCDDKTMFSGDICGPVAATMNESMFQFVHSKWRYAYDGLKETHDYQILAASGALMKIMIRMLDSVVRSLPENYNEAQTARVLLYKIFYDQTDQGLTHFLLNSIRSFDTMKQPKSYLADLLETIHIMLKLIETLQARGTLRVSRKARNARKKKQNLVQEELINDNVDEEQHKEPQTTLPEETLDSLNSLNESNPTEKLAKLSPAKDNEDVKVNNNDIDDDMSSSSGELSGDEQPCTTHEVDFKASSFLLSFATHSIVKNICWLLAFYKSNPPNINHYILSLLRRITDDLNLSPMLYQLSLLTTFYDILEEQKTCPSTEYAEIVEFLVGFIRKMMRKMKKRPFLFVEILFWKTKGECHCINADDLLHQLKSMKKDASSSFPSSDNGHLETSNNKEWAPRSLADALGDDEADVVIPHHQPHHIDEDDALHQHEEAPRRKKRFVLTEELGLRIKDLHERYKDSENCCREIAESLSAEIEVTPQQILNKLKQLGLSLPSKKTARRLPKVDETLADGDALLVEELVSPKSAKSDKTALRQSPTKSKIDEQKLKTLFEQFKDYKRCHQLIADALSGDKLINAAQVSRKLVKLGLRVPRKRISNSGKENTKDQFSQLGKSNHLQSDAGSFDETVGSDVIKISQKEKILDSDDEIIGSILKKQKREVEDSDDEIIGSHMKNKLEKRKSEDMDNEVTGILTKKKFQDIRDDDTDDEMIGSLIKKKIENKKTEDSDDEIIGSVRTNGSQKKRNDGSDDEDTVSFAKINISTKRIDGSDSEIVATFRKKKLQRRKAGQLVISHSKIKSQTQKDENSDDEIIGSLVTRWRKPIDKNSDYEDLGSVVNHPKQRGDDEDEHISSVASKSRNLKRKTTPTEDLPAGIDYTDELADSEDDAAPGDLGNSQPRSRKRRLVFDDDI